MGRLLETLWRNAIRRRKPTTTEGFVPYRKCITIVDLTSLGLANVLGTGMHVLLSQASHDSAGPSIVLSFIIVAVTALLSGLCYGELAEQFPGVPGGSCYAYAYGILGELSAFLLGWNTILELILGSAVAAKAWSQYAHLTFNGSLHSISESVPLFENTPRNVDITAFGLLVVATIFNSMYVKAVCIVNNVLVIIGCLFVGGTVMVGLFNMDPVNWTSGPGFFPNGFEGILSGASICTFTFIGMDVMVAVSMETTSHHHRTYSMAASWVFVLGLLGCFTFSVVVTLVVPYALLSETASITNVFLVRGIHAMRSFVFIGATCGLLASVLAIGIAQSRILQAMAQDGLLIPVLFHMHRTRRTPWIASLTAGIVSALLALLLELKTMLSVLGIGTLLVFSAAPIIVLVGRYEVCESSWGTNATLLELEGSSLSRDTTAEVIDDNESESGLYGGWSRRRHSPDDDDEKTELTVPSSSLPSSSSKHKELYGSLDPRPHSVAVEVVADETFRTSLATSQALRPTKRSSFNVKVSIGVYILLVLFVGLVCRTVRQGDRYDRTSSSSEEEDDEKTTIMFVSKPIKDLTLSIGCVAILGLVMFVTWQPCHNYNAKCSHNEMPCIPWLPMTTLAVHLILMTCLPLTAWIRLIVWSVLGFIFYFCNKLIQSNKVEPKVRGERKEEEEEEELTGSV